MLSKIKKDMKGITLIALVITIIVLLILAGVSIATLTGQNGILTQANNAKTQTEIANEKEAISLAYTGAMADKKGRDNVTADDMNRQFGLNGTEATASGSNPITVSFDSGREYTIDSNGNISDPEESNIIAKIKIEGEKVTTVPTLEGFSYKEGTIDTGYVVVDGEGNEFVWVPVDKNQKIKIDVTSKEEIESITLIALVITIIVLLILAGVSIATLTGQNGILTQANNAKENSEISEEKEAVSLAYTGVIAEKKGEGTVTANDLNIQFGLNGTDATATGSINVKFNKSERIYKIDSQGKITGPFQEGEIETSNYLVDMYNKAIADNCTNEDGKCTRVDHLHIGDYVNYENPKSGTYDVLPEKTGIEEGLLSTVPQTFDVADNQLNWRVLGIDKETGGLKLIAGSPMKNSSLFEKYNIPVLYLDGAAAYEYGADELDAISRLYKNENAVEARSVKIEDIGEILRNNNRRTNKAI